MPEDTLVGQRDAVIVDHMGRLACRPIQAEGFTHTGDRDGPTNVCRGGQLGSESGLPQGLLLRGS